jgi:hypothetical protein
MAYITEVTARNIAADVLAAHEVHPLSHRDKIRTAVEVAREDHGVRLNVAQTLYIVKLVNLGWHNTVQSTKRAAPKRSSLDQFI